ncbi:hypothetical protein [Legionella sp.]|uniref:hypothetical protein n=1 Tax=Legionella sp. TaxID=459 RepID=UPI003C806D37
MINHKSVKWGFAVVFSLGLSACNMWDRQGSRQANSPYEPMQSKHKEVSHKAKPVQKTYASKDPTQQATPGPVRKAAPQLPVIQ